MTPKEQLEEKVRLPKWFKKFQLFSGVIGSAFFTVWGGISYKGFKEELILYIGTERYGFIWVALFMIGLFGIGFSGMLTIIRFKTLDGIFKIIRNEHQQDDTK